MTVENGTIRRKVLKVTKESWASPPHLCEIDLDGSGDRRKVSLQRFEKVLIKWK